MIRPPVGVLRALAAVAALATLPAGAQTFPVTVEGRCEAGACTRTEFLSREEAARSADGVLWLVHQRTASVAGGRVRWRSPSEAYVFCSRVRPAFLFRDSDGPQWTVHLLAPGHPQAVTAYTFDSQQGYNQVCHGIAEVEGPAARALASQGYAADLVLRVDQFDVMDPREILVGR